jgi:NB-ARC domain
MSLRHALIPESEEPGSFPNTILPFSQNPRFYGRAVELEKIEKYLSPKDDQSLRTYTIYGRRGVGKTEIALQFAYMNQPGFDAIFWIQCETSVSIRQSFTNVAVALNLPGADRDGHHEENQLAVRNWLKKTCWSSLDEQLYLGVLTWPSFSKEVVVDIRQCGYVESAALLVTY